MTDQKRAQWVRNAIMVVIFGVAIVLGYFVKLPGFAFAKKGQLETVDPKADEAFHEAIAAKGQLTVVNAMIDGNPDSKMLKELLAQLKSDKYGDEMEAVDLDVKRQKTLADKHEIDVKEFAGQLDFYSAGEKLGTLKGKTDRATVEATIDRILAELVDRYGPNWQPKVEGMRKRGFPSQTVAEPAASKSNPSGVPGMQRAPSGVPGMTRAKPDQGGLKAQPQENP